MNDKMQNAEIARWMWNIHIAYSIKKSAGDNFPQRTMSIEKKDWR